MEGYFSRSPFPACKTPGALALGGGSRAAAPCLVQAMRCRGVQGKGSFVQKMREAERKDKL